MTPRFPPLPPEAQNDDQRRYAADAGGRETGPYHAFMRNPDLHRRLQPLRERFKAQTAVTPALLELATLMTAHHWRSEGVLAAHRPMALKAGLSADQIEAAASGERPADLEPDAIALHDFVAGLLASGRAADATYDAARAAFGEAALLDIIALMGLYTMVSMMLNVGEADGA
jgi:4-carboxymuconolactone decarboxylase